MHEGRGPCGSRFGLGGHVHAPVAHNTFLVAGGGIVLPQFSATLCLASWAPYAWTVYPQLSRAQGNTSAYQGSLRVAGVDNLAVLCLRYGTPYVA